MEIYKTSFAGHSIDVIFNGKTYLFYNSYCGFVAVANRVEAPTWEDHKKGETFRVLVGNHHTVGGSLTNSVISSGVRRFVTKHENKYIKTACAFQFDASKDLANSFLDLSAGFVIR